MVAIHLLLLLTVASAPPAGATAAMPARVLTSLDPSQVTVTGYLGDCRRGLTAPPGPVSALDEAALNAPRPVRKELALLRQPDCEAAGAAWSFACAHEVYLTGALALAEGESVSLRPPTGDQCEVSSVLSWLWLNQAMLEATGDPRYADLVGKLLWNQLPAMRCSDGTTRRYCPPDGPCPPSDEPTPEACSMAAERGLALAPALIYATGPAGVYVNQYCASSATLKTPGGQRLVLAQHTRYPARDAVTLTVRLAKDERFTIFLRVPAWSVGPTVRLFYFAPKQATPGTYYALTRTWSDKDTVHLRFPSNARWVRGTGPTGGLLALTRGPLVFVLPGPKAAYPPSVCTTEVPQPFEAPVGTLGPVLKVSVGPPAGVSSTASMIPFANISSLPLDAPYVTWLKPGASPCKPR